MTETQQTMTEFTYATGETDVIGDRFSPSVVLFWGLRVKMCVWLGVSRGLDLAFLNAD